MRMHGIDEHRRDGTEARVDLRGVEREQLQNRLTSYRGAVGRDAVEGVVARMPARFHRSRARSNHRYAAPTASRTRTTPGSCRLRGRTTISTSTSNAFSSAMSRSVEYPVHRAFISFDTSG